MISLAYSPDTDDAFMVHAMQSGLVDTRGYEFRYTSADIQELNEAAREGVYDLTAISVAAYPSIAAQYELMSIGASIGDAFGPAVIVATGDRTTSLAELAGKRIAVPGLQTSAFCAARRLIGGFTPVPMYFKDIAPAVARGEVDAGILIHELQLDCDRDGVRKLDDLGAAWTKATALPLPLGANAIRRALGRKVIDEVTAIFKASIEWGLAHRDEALQAALRSSGAPIDARQGDRYISMYVNRRSLGFDDDVRAAIARLLDAGAATEI